MTSKNAQQPVAGQPVSTGTHASPAHRPRFHIAQSQPIATPKEAVPPQPMLQQQIEPSVDDSQKREEERVVLEKRAEEEQERTDVEIEKVVEQVGGAVISNTPVVSEELQSLGVQKTEENHLETQKRIDEELKKLPLSEPDLVTGLQAPVMQNIRWLATWCLRKLGKAHVAVKVVSGQLVKTTMPSKNIPKHD